MKRLPLPAFVLEADWRAKLKWFGAEIVIVVAGVLIALALNAWWAERTQQQALREALVAVEEDFRATQQELDNVQAENRAYQEGVKALLLINDTQIDALPSDSLESLFNLLTTGGLTFDPTMGAVEALVAGGGVRLIEDVALRTQIAAWPGVVDEMAEDQAIMIDMFMAQQDRVAETGFTTLVLQAFLRGEFAGGGFDEFARPALKQVIADEVMLNRLAAHFMAIGGLGDELNEAEAHIERTLALLQEAQRDR